MDSHPTRPGTKLKSSETIGHLLEIYLRSQLKKRGCGGNLGGIQMPATPSSSSSAGGTGLPGWIVTHQTAWAEDPDVLALMSKTHEVWSFENGFKQ